MQNSVNENGESNQFTQARDNRPEENLRARELLIQASEVLHPRDRFLRNYIESPSILLMNNLSKTALCYLALTAEAIGGIAGYCYTKYPENAMNGANITEANITGTNITGTNILSEMNSRSNCMEQNTGIAMIAIPLALLLLQGITKISDSFRSRRSLGEARGVAPQNNITIINRENQQAAHVSLVVEIVNQV